MFVRSCHKCGVSIERTTTRGPAVCDGCRAPKDQPRSRPHRSKMCGQCGRKFTGRSTGDLCRACIHRNAKHPCARCGEPCDKRATICLACLVATTLQSGPGNHNWKGGRTKHKLHGYVRVKIPTHPRAAKDGYVREHQIVMEEALGRYLLPGENVHHRNGDKGDNRIENLELWVVSQPAGQRAVDLLAWAREIVARYEPIEPRL